MNRQKHDFNGILIIRNNMNTLLFTNLSYFSPF